MMISIVSCAYLPSIYIFLWSVHSNLFLIACFTIVEFWVIYNKYKYTYLYITDIKYIFSSSPLWDHVICKNVFPSQWPVFISLSASFKDLFLILMKSNLYIFFSLMHPAFGVLSLKNLSLSQAQKIFPLLSSRTIVI